MKVLMLGWELPPYNSGGLGVACVQLCKSLASKGADITFVVPYEASHKLDFMKVISAKIAKTHEINGVYDSQNYTKNMGVAGNIYDIQHKYVEAVTGIIDQHGGLIVANNRSTQGGAKFTPSSAASSSSV